MALKIVGAEKSKIYDGSWTEYVSFFCLKFRAPFPNRISASRSGIKQVRSEVVF